MAHVRTQLRTAAVTLFSGLPTTGTRVKANRALPLAKDAQPRLAVRTPSEQAQDLSATSQSRVIVLRADITAKGTDEAALCDLLDQAALEIELAAAGDPTFGGIAQAYEYRGADLSLDGTGERIVGTLSLAFDVSVYTARTDPETAL